MKNAGLSWKLCSVFIPEKRENRRRGIFFLPQKVIWRKSGSEWKRENPFGSGTAISPDELCGFYWILDQLECLRQQTPLGAVYGVKLPVWERIGEDKVRVRNSWGEVSPGEWSGYLSLQERLPEGFCRACADVWRQLRRENGCLRAVLNGRLVSVPDSLYDTFLMRELQTLEGEFSESEWIGRVLGNYNLGIGDGWLALRIEEKIRAGELEIVREAENGDPRYHRILRKKSETGTF